MPDCRKYFGPCGICRDKHVKDYKKDYMVVYVGDGYMDRCAVKAADLVFAKDNLAKYCESNGIKHRPLCSFKDIKGYIISCI